MSNGPKMSLNLQIQIYRKSIIIIDLACIIVDLSNYEWPYKKTQQKIVQIKLNVKNKLHGFWLVNCNKTFLNSDIDCNFTV